MKKRLITIFSLIVLSAILLVSCDVVVNINGKDETTVDTETAPVTETEDSGPETEKSPTYHTVYKSDDGRLVLWDDSVSPVSVEYTFLGYAPEYYSTEDKDLIDKLVATLKKVKVGKTGAVGGSDNSDEIVFNMDDGSVYRVTFNFGNLEVYMPNVPGSSDKDGYYNIYETEGFKEVKQVLSEIAGNE